MAAEGKCARSSWLDNTVGRRILSMYTALCVVGVYTVWTTVVLPTAVSLVGIQELLVLDK